MEYKSMVDEGWEDCLVGTSHRSAQEGCGPRGGCFMVELQGARGRGARVTMWPSWSPSATSKR